MLVIISILFICTLTATSLPAATLSHKRIYSEFRDIVSDNLCLDVPFNISNKEECGVRLSPLKTDMFEWHFSFMGMEGSPFDGGIYHGRIILDRNYPQKAPMVSISTASGRWKVDTNICLSASSHHPELWDPSWNLRTLVLSLRGFMATNPGEIGSLRRNTPLQRQLAVESVKYSCPQCRIRHSDILLGRHNDEREIDVTEKNKKISNNNRRNMLNVLTGLDSAFALERSPTKVTAFQATSSRHGLNKHSRTNRKRKSQVVSSSSHSRKRLKVARTVLFYSSTLLLFGLWRLCVGLIEDYFIGTLQVHSS